MKNTPSGQHSDRNTVDNTAPGQSSNSQVRAVSPQPNTVPANSEELAKKFFQQVGFISLDKRSLSQFQSAQGSSHSRAPLDVSTFEERLQKAEGTIQSQNTQIVNLEKQMQQLFELIQDKGYLRAA